MLAPIVNSILITRWARLLLLLVVPLGFAVLLTQHHVRSWNDASRLAAVESLVHRGTYSIDESRFADTGDKVLIGDRYYSDKQPFLIVLMAGAYAVLHHTVGIDLQADPVPAIYWLCLIFMGGLWILALNCLYCALGHTGIGEPWRLILALTSGIGTTWLTWTTVLNNHAVAAALLMVGLCCFLATPRSRAPLATGFFVAMAAMCELQYSVFIVGFAWLYAQARTRPSGLGLYLAGTLPPLIIAFSLNWFITGDLVPVKLHAEYFDYPNSAFDRDSLSGFIHHDIASFATYAFNALFGRAGLLLYNPLLLVSIFGIARQIKGGGAHRDLAIMFAACAVVVVAYVLLFTSNYGGGSFGMRWFVALIPFACFFSYEWFVDMTRRRALLYGALFVCGFAIMLLGSVNPWSRTYVEPHPMKANLLMLEEVLNR